MENNFESLSSLTKRDDIQENQPRSLEPFLRSLDRLITVSNRKGVLEHQKAKIEIMRDLRRRLAKLSPTALVNEKTVKAMMVQGSLVQDDVYRVAENSQIVLRDLFSSFLKREQTYNLFECEEFENEDHRSRFFTKKFKRQ